MALHFRPKFHLSSLLNLTCNELRFDVYSEKQQYLYSIPMLDLFSTEETLMGGRFELYSKAAQEHVVSIRTETDGATYRKEFRDMVEWIAEQGTSVWSFWPEPEAVGKGLIRFSFADLVTAVAFKLVWHG